jgi:hypothetical protein
MVQIVLRDIILTQRNSPADNLRLPRATWFTSCAIPIAHVAYICSVDDLVVTVQDLLCITGSIDAGKGSKTGYNEFERALQSAQQHSLPHEVLTGRQVNQRFPGYKLPDDYMVGRSMLGCVCLRVLSTVVMTCWLLGCRAVQILLEQAA